MDRTSQQRARSARRFVIGVTLAAASTIAWLSAAQPASATAPRIGESIFSDPLGVVGTVATDGPIDPGNPFFQELGTNGRTCATCHRPAQAWTITPAELRRRFERTDGLDPIFRTNDGSSCEGADISTIDARRHAFRLLLTKGLIRRSLDIPAGAEFDIIDVDDPYACGAPLASPSVYRRPLPATNVAFLSAVMWDGRGTLPDLAIRDDLAIQARDAITFHAQGAVPADGELRAIADFEIGLFTAQSRDRGAGSLSAGAARGGPAVLAQEPFCIGVNDPLGILPTMPGACERVSSSFDPRVFSLFDAWTTAHAPERQAIARGERIFDTREFVIADVPGLNGGPHDPVRGPIQHGTCTVCHDTPNVGNHSVPLALNIGVADVSRRAADLPLYTLRNRATGDIVRTTDPGRALVTGRWDDMSKFKGPVLRALAPRAPYFHDGSAATLGDVVAFYDTRFRIGLTDQERADLIAFLGAL